MRFCFIVEERYRRSRLPMSVVGQLGVWGHEVTVLEPSTAIVSLAELVRRPAFDAVVLRTLSSGPGLNLLEAAGAAGITTINDAQAIRRTREKPVAAALARARGIPFPETYFVNHAGLLDQVPDRHFPLVVKPTPGGFGRGVHLLRGREEARTLDPDCFAGGYAVAQPWVPNAGYDVKLYNTGRSVHAVRRASPLMGAAQATAEVVTLTPALRRLAERVGWAFGLHIYGVDVVRGPVGWVAVDVNDFPSFGMIPDAPTAVAHTVIDLARRAARYASAPTRPSAEIEAPVHRQQPAATAEESVGRLR